MSALAKMASYCLIASLLFINLSEALDKATLRETLTEIKHIRRRHLERRLLDELVSQKIGTDLNKLKNPLQCNDAGQKCRMVQKCCGKLQCYWEKGFSMVKEGVCVQCVQAGLNCVVDRNCCEGMMCVRGTSLLSSFSVDGVCRQPSVKGYACYKDEQCASKNCQKKFYEMSGHCT